MRRNVGIIGDGTTDRLIFLKLVETILSESVNTITLKRQKIRDYIDRYWRLVTTEDKYSLTSEPAVKLQNQILATLIGAFDDYQKQIGSLSNQDILIVSTDSERSLRNAEAYFEDWAFSLSMILAGTIHKFYHLKANEGYLQENLPIILPIVTFPSTEIIIAAAKKLRGFYGKNARDLKLLLYGTTNLNTLNAGDLKEKALNFITSQNINLIFKSIPEARIFIQILSLGKSIC